jgi:hypothetical protein
MNYAFRYCLVLSLKSISDNLQYSDFPVIQKFHFYRASLRHTLFFFCTLFVAAI